MPALPRRRVHHVTAAAALAAVASLFPFLTVCAHREAFQPPPLRAAMLACYCLSCAFNLCSALLSTLAWLLHKSAYPVRNQIHADDVHHLSILLLSVSFAAVGCFLVVTAQAIWTYIASQVRIVWVLCLAVLGLALFLLFMASSLFMLRRILKVRNNDAPHDPSLADANGQTKPHSHDIHLEIDKDAFSPQRIVATIPAHDSELVF